MKDSPQKRNLNYNVFRRDQKEKLERNWLNFLFHIRPLAFLYCRTFFEKAMFCAMSKRKICVEETRVRNYSGRWNIIFPQVSLHLQIFNLQKGFFFVVF